jgi:hypothetical protein
MPLLGCCWAISIPQLLVIFGLLVDTQIVVCNTNLAHTFEAFFHQCIELPQGDFTLSRAGLYSRLDRCYTNLRTSDLIDVKPLAQVSWMLNSFFRRQRSLADIFCDTQSPTGKEKTSSACSGGQAP